MKFRIDYLYHTRHKKTMSKKFLKQTEELTQSTSTLFVLSVSIRVCVRVWVGVCVTYRPVAE